MLFNSFEFLVFIVIVYTVYWLLKGKRIYQNPFLLCVSYLFYGWWDWRFLFLLLLSTVIDYSFGHLIYKGGPRQKLYLWLSVFNNLIVLLFFKYFNFFTGSTVDMLRLFGLTMNPIFIKIVLPVGISFYTFHGMSYVFDIYNGKFKPVKNFFDYGLFVSFFPLLVAGPIERATHLLPQLTRERKFKYSQSVDGLRLILWGLFKKVVIADNCALFVNPIFNNYAKANSVDLAMAALMFAFQIYGDFSGYSDIARGTAKLFGIELLVNFKTPYFSRDIAEFWRRWHISLSSWFKDYLYIPLGGSKGGRAMAVRNTFIIFIVSGFWHGANWTFICWGILNAVYFLPLLLTNKNRSNLLVVAEHSMLPTFKEFLQIIVTFAITVFAWILFRSNTLHDAVSFLAHIPKNIHRHMNFNLYHPYNFILILFFICIDWMTRKSDFAGFCNTIRLKPLRLGLYFLLFALIGLYGAFTHADFIYFQF